MQITKTYSGEITLEEKTEKREYSYGGSGTMSVYPSKVDTVNNIIAGFLRSICGVTAFYEPREGSDYPFLWIWDVPFLFTFNGTANNVLFCPPCGAAYASTSYQRSTSSTTDVSNFFSGNKYSFSIVFTGNPDNGFVIRFKNYNASSFSSNFVLRFMKCENLINGSDAVVWGHKSIYSDENSDSSSVTNYMLSGMNGIDVVNHIINQGSFSTEFIKYSPHLFTKKIHRESNDGALPLVPLHVGPYRANGIYLRPVGFGLPNSASITAEVQNEITIGSRSFVITNNDGTNANLINMGLIETT